MAVTELIEAFSALQLGAGSPLDFLFEPWSFHFGKGDIFAKNRWNSIMNGAKIGTAFVAAGFLLLEIRARRLGSPIPKVWAKRIYLALVVFSTWLYFDGFNPNVRYVNYYHRHELFHYYLGSKYFKEVGSPRLYECAAVAETELVGKNRMKDREIRDLGVNLVKPMSKTYIFDIPENCKDHFSGERWDAFKADVKWIEQSARGQYWKDMFKDHGYNPPPVWTMTGHLLSSIDVASDSFFKKLALLDVILHIGVISMLGWAFGFRAMMIGAVFWGCNAPANFYWTGGAFMRMDWIFLLVSATAFAKKRYFALAGAALAWSALLRVFPAILFGGWVAMGACFWLKHRRAMPELKRALGGVIVAVGILVPASMAVCGPDSYAQFKHHISTHKSTPLTNHMGLETILTHNWEGRMRFSRDDRLDDGFQPWKDGRTQRKEERRPLFYLVWALTAGWIGWALRRTRLIWIAIPMGVPMVIALLNLTCYYYSVFIPIAALATVRRSLGPALLTTAGASQVLLGPPNWSTFYWIDDRYTALSYLFWLMALLTLYAYSRPLTPERLRAWWAGRAEPRAN